MRIDGGRHITTVAALALLIAAAMLGCRGVTEDGHVRPAFMRVEVGEQSIEATTLETTGAITLAAGSSAPLAIVFVSAQGEVITLGPDHFVEVEIVNTAVTDFEPVQPGAGTGQLHALAAGTTNATVRIMHGRIDGRAHADWTASAFSVVVTD